MLERQATHVPRDLGAALGAGLTTPPALGAGLTTPPQMLDR